MSQSVKRKKKKKFLFCYLQGQGHSEGSYDPDVTLSTIFSELWIPWQPNLVWWYIIISQNVLWKKCDNCIQGQGWRVKNVNVCLLNHQTFCFQTWHCDAATWVKMSCKKKLFAIFKVKVTARTHTIKIWQFLQYLLNCWSFCNQTWFDSTLS